MFKTPTPYPGSRENLRDSSIARLIELLEPSQATLTVPERLFDLDLPLRDEKSLRAFVRQAFGVHIPDVQVCPQHSTPWRAFADAYFGRSPVTVWEASRAFGGKSYLCAVLGLTEALTLGCDVNILGGSGEQAKRVHEYMTRLWRYPTAPRSQLRGDPSGTRTTLAGGNRLTALMASQASVRGPHPARLLIDEVDEVAEPIYDAAMGQPLDQKVNQGTEREWVVPSHTVLSSTHQYANGTMTMVLKRAEERGWHTHVWCYRESMANGEGWLTNDQVAKKRSEMSEQSWNTEVELQEPNPTDRAIQPESVEKMYRKDLGSVPGDNGVYYEFEVPVVGARYSTGADWARKQDMTIIVTHRIDCRPVRVVAWERMNRLPWPVMVEKFDKRLERYHNRHATREGGWRGVAYYDATGLGDVVGGYIRHEAQPFMMVGRDRSDLLSDYITAIEGGEIISPFIQYAYGEHLYASVDDVYGTGHLPDTISAGALAWIPSGPHGGWSRSAGA